MEKLFVPYKIALLLKKKGFDEPCLGSYNILHGLIVGDEFFTNNIPAPIHQQAIDWLFKKLDLYYPYLKIEIFSDGSGSWYHPKDDGNDKLEIDFDNIEQGIEEALKLIK